MFIATSSSNDPSSEGAKCDSLDSYFAPTELLSHIEPLGYRYFVPTGLWPFIRTTATHLQSTTPDHDGRFLLSRTTIPCFRIAIPRLGTVIPRFRTPILDCWIVI